MLGGDTNIDTATSKMRNFATATNETLVGMTSLLEKIKGNKLGGAILGTFGDVLSNLQPFASFRKEGAKVNLANQQKFAQGAPAELAALSKYSTVQDKVVKNAKTLTKLSAQQVKDLKLKAAIEKANLALAKGDDIFNMDKIQIAAALTNQAEQLGKATTGAQILQIANDTARLKVKQDILALEDAIASGDQKAIEAATKKLNADMAILGSLQNQSIKLLDIKSILDTLKPKDLINTANLEEALRLLGLINLASTGSKTTPAGGYGAGGGGNVANNQYSNQVGNGLYGMQTQAASIADINAAVAAGGLSSIIGTNLQEYLTPSSGLLSGISANGREFNFNIAVNTGIGDPNAIAEAVNQVIQDAVDRGTLRGGAY
jgi:hypothetical protein